MPDAPATSQPQSQPATIPSWITPALMARTRQVLEPRYGQPLTDDEVIEILGNVGAVGDFLRGDIPLDSSEDFGPPDTQQLQEIA